MPSPEPSGDGDGSAGETPGSPERSSSEAPTGAPSAGFDQSYQAGKGAPVELAPGPPHPAGTDLGSDLGLGSPGAPITETARSILLTDVPAKASQRSTRPVALSLPDLEGACTTACLTVGTPGTSRHPRGQRPAGQPSSPPPGEKTPLASTGAASASSAGAAGGAVLGVLCVLLLMAVKRWSRLLQPPLLWRPAPALSLPERPG